MIVAFAGYCFASAGHIFITKLLWTLVGTSLVIAAACVINNIIDINRDKQMSRTKNRVLVTGEMSLYSASIYAGILGASGVFVLWNFVNMLTLIVGIIGFIDYVFIYTLLKSKTHHATLLGGISGAMPPVAGYVAVTNAIDMNAILLFLALLFWQMPHFFAISLFRKKDYAAAHVAILPIKKSDKATQRQMLFYTFGFMLSCIALSVFGGASKLFAVIMSLASLYWIWYGLKGYKTDNVIKWAKGMFGISLLILLIFSLLLSVDFWFA